MRNKVRDRSALVRLLENARYEVLPTATTEEKVLANVPTDRTITVTASPAKGLDQAFAKKLEISPSMWSQIKSARPIGDTLARQIERHCGVDAGWLDREDLATDAPDPAEERFIAAARQAWRSANAKGKRALSRRIREPFLPGSA